MYKPEYCPNIFLNHDITMEEVKRAVDKAKLNKTSRIEGFSNEALKSPKLLEVLFHLFKNCFEHNVIPSVWLKSIIKPPKTDPRVLLNYWH